MDLEWKTGHRDQDGRRRDMPDGGPVAVDACPGVVDAVARRVVEGSDRGVQGPEMARGGVGSTEAVPGGLDRESVSGDQGPGGVCKVREPSDSRGDPRRAAPPARFWLPHTGESSETPIATATAPQRSDAARERARQLHSPNSLTEANDHGALTPILNACHVVLKWRCRS